MWGIDRPSEPAIRCSVCGVELTGDADDDPWHPTGPVCGDCARARADDELMWALASHDPDEGIW